RKTLVEHGSVLIDINGDTLSATMLNLNGSIRDTFSLVKRGKSDPARIALPWQPPEYKAETAKNNPAQPPIDFKVLIPQYAQWTYLSGAHPRGLDWTLLDFNPAGWKTAPVGIGFGDSS